MNEPMHTMMADGAAMNSHVMKGAAVMSVGYVAGRSLLGRLFASPLVVFAAGVAVGYYGYKYRKEIAAAVAKGSDLGKDWVLNAKENLADLVEETREAEEAVGKAQD